MSSTLTQPTIQHLQDLINLPMEFKEVAISDPLLRAMAIAIFEKTIVGNWYLVRGNPEVRDFDFSIFGFNGKPQLTMKGSWIKHCRKCGKKIPVFMIRRILHLRDPIPNRIEQYNQRTEILGALFTLECGEKYFDGFLTESDLLRR